MRPPRSSPSLTVWGFGSVRAADEAARLLERLAQDDVVDLHDASIVCWEEGAKKPRTRLLAPITVKGSLGGSFWGLLFGLIFFVPLLGAAIGAATGVHAGSLDDLGIDDGFMNRVRDQVTPGTSALFLLASDAVVDRVRDVVGGLEPDVLITTGLTEEQDAALRRVCDGD